MGNEIPEIDIDTSSDLGQLIQFHMAGAFGALFDKAQVMAQAGFRHPLHALMLAQAALHIGEAQVFDDALILVEQIRAADPEAARIMVEFTRDVIMPQVAPAYAGKNNPLVLGYLAIARRVLPELATIFTPDQIVSATPPGAGHLISLSMPPGRRARSHRHVLFLMRKFYFGPESREHDFGARMQAGMARGGWSCLAMDPTFIGRNWQNVSGNDLFQILVAQDSDVVIVDFCGLALPPGALTDFISLCRRLRPATKIVLIHFDPWQTNTWSTTVMLAAHADLIWSHFPAVDLWQAEALQGKVSFAPFPVGIDIDDLPAIDRAPISVFQGAVESYNATRAFWLASIEDQRAPMVVRLTGHADDGLPALDSYRHYLQGFLNCQRLINFSMRQDGSRIITGRTFEAIHAGCCLIQEQADDIDHYFEAGRHYLSFRTLGELVDILHDVSLYPERARIIARQGQDHYRLHYDDALLVAHLDQVLFG